MGVQVASMHRTYYLLDTSITKRTNMVKYNELPSHIVPYEQCNLIGSAVPDSKLHMPMFDIDDPANLEYMGLCLPGAVWIPSRTAGHWHAYIQCAMPWTACAAMLIYHIEMRTIDLRWGEACLDQKQMFLRKPLSTEFIP